MVDKKEIELVFGDRFVYDDYGQMIFGVHKKIGHQVAFNVEDSCLSVRGWGAIENAFGCKQGERFQDAFGRWVVDALNEKLSRCLTDGATDANARHTSDFGWNQEFESGTDIVKVDMDFDETETKMELSIKSANDKSLQELEEQESPALGVAMNFFEFLNGGKPE